MSKTISSIIMLAESFPVGYEHYFICPGTQYLEIEGKQYFFSDSSDLYKILINIRKDYKLKYRYVEKKSKRSIIDRDFDDVIYLCKKIQWVAQQISNDDAEIAIYPNTGVILLHHKFSQIVEQESYLCENCIFKEHLAISSGLWSSLYRMAANVSKMCIGVSDEVWEGSIKKQRYETKEEYDYRISNYMYMLELSQKLFDETISVDQL